MQDRFDRLFWRDLLQKHNVIGEKDTWETLIRRYSGNPLALKQVAATIRDLFGGDIAMFLQEDVTAFGDIRDLLDNQFTRLSEREQELMYWLAIEREPVSLEDLREDLVRSASKLELLEAVKSLREKSIIEIRGKGHFALQPVVLEYVTGRFIEHIVQELQSRSLRLFMSHALIKAQAKDYVREIQIRFILKPIVEKLTSTLSREETENFLKATLSTLHSEYSGKPGYSGGNLLNLLNHFGINLNGYDFSHLAIWQSYLRNVTLHDINFAYADLSHSVFTETFGSILSVAAFSPNGEILAGGGSGELRLWQIADNKPLFDFKGHADWIESVTFSPDSCVLFTGSSDTTVKLWDVNTGQCLKTLQGHMSRVKSVVCSSDGFMAASGSDDQTLRLWDLNTSRCLKILRGHTNKVRIVDFSSDSQILASGSDDQTIRLWNISTGRCLKILEGHTNWLWSVAFSPDGYTLASSSEDRTVKLWDINTGRCIETLHGYTNQIWSVAFNPDGSILASGSEDEAIRLWDVNTGQPLKTLYGHSNWINFVTFNLDGSVLASCNADRTIKLWDVNSGRCLRTLEGLTDSVFSVTFNPKEGILASCSQDQTVMFAKTSNYRASHNIFTLE